MSYFAVASAVVGLTTGIISGANEAKKNKEAIRLATIQNQLDYQRQKDLDKATLKANNDNTKLKIVADSVANIKASREQAVINAKAVAQQYETKNLVTIAVGGGVIIVGAIAVLKLA